ncbi:MAG: zf-HC2 domain-containing protein [Candidatus Acidiferrales bacterium]
MCNESGKLVAWLDGELPPAQAAEIEAHLRGCEECRGKRAAIEQTTAAVREYCDAQMAANAPRTARRAMVTALAVGVATIAAVIAMLVVLPRLRTVEPPVGPRPEAVPTIALASAPPAVRLPAPVLDSPAKPEHHRRVVAAARNLPAAGPFAEPSIQIAIPAEAVFPPGAFPEGVNFVAEVSIGPDESAAPVFVRP